MKDKLANSGINPFVFGRVLLIISILEVSLGGGGRLFNTGWISPRMVLFGLGLAYTVAAVLLYRTKIPRDFVFLTVIFVALSIVSALVSASENQPVLAALNDFKPLAYFLMLPFFAVAIRNVGDVVLVGRLLKFSAFMLAVLYLGVMAFWKSGGMTASQMYEWLNPTHTAEAEFLFRGDTTFLFKAALYVGVGVFFFVLEKNLIRRSVVLLLLLAIALTMTRGMWLSVFMVLAVWAFFYAANRTKGAALAAGLLLVGVMGVVWINETLPSVAYSNATRMNDLRILAAREAPEVPEALPERLFGRLVGRGFGAPVAGREAIEITYVNVLLKQGAVGLSFWFLPLAYLTWQMRFIQDAVLQSLALPYFMAAAFVYLASFSNPFLTNPIGMAIVIIAMVAIRVIRHSRSAGIRSQ